MQTNSLLFIDSSDGETSQITAGFLTCPERNHKKKGNDCISQWLYSFEKHDAIPRITLNDHILS